MKILAIETSCDDTSVAIVEDGYLILSSVVSSQGIHNEFGGVVPEVAAREHIKNMLPVLDDSLNTAEVAIEDVDAIAVTKGPGLVGSLITGVNTARTLAYAYKKPLIAVHHTEGHIYANWLSRDDSPGFPLVCLTVSGGHTNLIYMKNHLDYEIIGETHDDSAGEAYDKVAKMLGLGYPGGPIIYNLALKGNPDAYKFPLVDLTKAPERNKEGFLVNALESLDFSYSGLKTAVLREVKALKQGENEISDQDKANIAASFQKAANSILARNLLRAVKRHKPKSILLSGGVASNLNLRKIIQGELKKADISAKLYFPEPKNCTDNAAMIGAAAYRHALINDYIDPKDITPDPNYKLKSI